MTRIALLDDSLHVAEQSADWDRLRARGCRVDVLIEPMTQDEAAARLADYQVLVPMRERTPFPASLLARLPRLKLIALTGARAPTLDIAACTANGILVCNTGGAETTAASTSELTWGLILAAQRHIPQADASMRTGGWHVGLPVGPTLEGQCLGIVGLGRLGSRVAQYGRAFGMEVVAWSSNLTESAAREGGARLVPKQELFATADVISLHLVLSDRSRDTVGAAELAAMKPGALLVNTSRGPLVDEAALLESLTAGRVRAALDVYAQEPLPANHPLRTAPNTVLAPHLGYSSWPVLRRYYGESLDNILAWLDGTPTRVLNPA